MCRSRLRIRHVLDSDDCINLSRNLELLRAGLFVMVTRQVGGMKYFYDMNMYENSCFQSQVGILGVSSCLGSDVFSQTDYRL